MMTDRDKLAFRVLPSMTLATGAGVSAPPPPPPPASTPAERAAYRFAVTGNAIVTGGSGGLGLAACEALLEHGLQGLAVFDVNAEEAEPRLAGLRAKFPEAKIGLVVVDVTDAAAVETAVAQAETLLGPVGILLCFAGIVDTTPALELTPELWRRILEVNTTGSFLCAQAVARRIAARHDQDGDGGGGGGGGGSIVLVASISGHVVNFPQPQVNYNASKAAVLSIKSSLAAEWARYGIRVNSLSPGYMETILNEGDGLKSHRRIWASRNPTGRIGYPEELTGAVVLLASRAGSYINGADILVDGGQTLF